MRPPSFALLLVAAFGQPTFGAARWEMKEMKEMKELKEINEVITNLWKEILNRLPPRHFRASNVTVKAAGATTTTSEIPSTISTLQRLEPPASTELQLYSSTEKTVSTEISSSLEIISSKDTIFSTSIDYKSPVTPSDTRDQTPAPSEPLHALNLSSSISTLALISTPSASSSPSPSPSPLSPPLSSTSTIWAWTTTTTEMKVATPELTAYDTTAQESAPSAPINAVSDPSSQAGEKPQRVEHESNGQPRFSEPSSTHQDPGSTPEGNPSGSPDPQIESVVYENTRPPSAEPLAGPTYHCPPSGTHADCAPDLSPTYTYNQTWGYRPTNTTKPPILPPAGSCTSVADDDPVTEYSIIYTATVTFYGNISDYAPPYQPIETPNYCGTSVIHTGHTRPTSFATSEGRRTFTEPETAKVSAESCDDDYSFTPPAYKTQTVGGQLPTQTSPKKTLTFITTDKNPSVVYPTRAPPRYSRPNNGAGPGGNRLPGQHITVPLNEQTGGRKGGQGFESQGVGAPLPVYTVAIMGEQIIINDQTFSNLQPSQTSTVTVGDGVFTILPTAVVGQGTTVGKPQPVGTAAPAIAPQNTVVGNVPVVVSGSEAVICGSTFTIPPAGTETTAIINNEPVSIGAGGLIIHGQTLTFQTSGPQYTDVIVQGGEMITAAGQSICVFHQTTVTYGSGISETTEVVDDDTITIGPAGVTVHGKTLGGPSALPSRTTYEIVGGATISRLSPTFVAIDGTTFIVGPGATTTTKFIGGETVTIGPGGVTISSLTLAYPFGPSSVVTIKPSATDAAKSATAKNTSDGKTNDNDGGQNDKKDDESMGASLRPNYTGGLSGLCIAIGVCVLI